MRTAEVVNYLNASPKYGFNSWPRSLYQKLLGTHSFIVLCNQFSFVSSQVYFSYHYNFMLHLKLSIQFFFFVKRLVVGGFSRVQWTLSLNESFYFHSNYSHGYAPFFQAIQPQLNSLRTYLLQHQQKNSSSHLPPHKKSSTGSTSSLSAISVSAAAAANSPIGKS